jgi:ketosteroid isomerase-like protein
MTTAPQADRESIHLLLRKISAAWRNGHIEELNAFFHDDMVIVGPDLGQLPRGRAACVQSYRDFMGTATVHEYNESEPVIEVWGGTAVTTSAWEMTYEMNGQVLREAGQEVFAFARDSEGWRVVWRALLPSPPKIEAS